MALIGLLDRQRAEIAERIAAANEAHKSSLAKQHEAQQKVDRLGDTREQLAQETRDRIKREQTELEEANARSFEVIQGEVADRRNAAYVRASDALKRDLVQRALDSTAVHYKATITPERHAELIEAFAQDLERKAS